MAHHTTEEKLLERLKKDDSKAFESLFNMYKGRMFLFTLKFVKSEDFASDILHDVFLKLWEKRNQLKPELNFSSYLHTICKNRIFNFLKQVSRQEALKLEIIHYTRERQNSLEDDFYFNEYEKIADQAVNQLPPRRKEVFQLCKLDGKSYDETATNLGISRNAVKDHMIKANIFVKSYFLKHGEISI